MQNAQKYAISSIDEAKAYMMHPVLGPRLLECTEAVLTLSTKDCPAFLGYIDSLKLCSCMTLFANAAPEYTAFQKVIDKFYNGEQDKRTLELIGL